MIDVHGVRIIFCPSINSRSFYDIPVSWLTFHTRTTAVATPSGIKPFVIIKWRISVKEIKKTKPNNCGENVIYASAIRQVQNMKLFFN